MRNPTKNDKAVIFISLMLITLALALWWLLSPEPASQITSVSEGAEVTANASGFVSAIRPVSEANAQDAARGGILFNKIDSQFDAEQESQMSKDFALALSAQNDGDIAVAEKLLGDLIDTYPQLPEPYVNLAALYSSTDQIDKARDVLVRGLSANPNTSALFESLQKVYGAQAAAAYQKALNSKNVKDEPLTLPVLSRISLPSAPVISVPASQDQDEQQSEQQVEQQQALATADRQIASLRDEIAALKSQYESQIASLQKELANQALLTDAGLTDTGAQAVSPPKEVASTQNAAAITQPPTDTQAELAAKELARKRQQNAISAVQRWAQAWSDQDVNSYVTSYSDGYVPDGSGLSHSQWVEQRKARLSNKRFIKVKVSDFRVADVGSRFSVQFKQNYQSDTINDTIFKKLTFTKQGDDWSNAKIVSEAIVRR